MDQAAVAALVLAALGSMALWWLFKGGATGRVIEIDRAPRGAIRFTVDVNEADWPELAQLPQIGETLARRIVESRRVEGPFVDLEELQRVRGIGPRTLEGIRPYLRPIPPAANVAGRGR